MAPDELKPWQRPPFEPGHELSIRHGAYSLRKIGSRAEEIRTVLLTEHPELADAGQSLLVDLFCQLIATADIAHKAIDDGNLSPRLIESMNGSANRAKEIANEIAYSDRGAAELTEIRSRASLNLVVLAQQAPVLLAALEGALAELGLAERSDEFRAAFNAQLAAVADGDD